MKIRHICWATLGFGGISASIATPILLMRSGGGDVSRKTSPDLHTWDCYKWIIDRGTSNTRELGEIAACLDRRKETSIEPPSLLFVLWWLKEPSSPEYNTFTEISSIKKEVGDTISVTYKSGNGQKTDKKLKFRSNI